MCTAHLHYLHSFPTLRSSDLCRKMRCRCCASTSFRSPIGPLPSTGSATSSRRRDRFSSRSSTSTTTSPCATRSEEHTSELQSLRHLVCRLLLEKKKRLRCKSH